MYIYLYLSICLSIHIYIYLSLAIYFLFVFFWHVLWRLNFFPFGRYPMCSCSFLSEKLPTSSQISIMGTRRRGAQTVHHQHDWCCTQRRFVWIHPKYPCKGTIQSNPNAELLHKTIIQPHCIGGNLIKWQALRGWNDCTWDEWENVFFFLFC